MVVESDHTAAGPGRAAAIDRLVASMQQLQAHPGLGGLALGVPEWDAALWRLGRDWPRPRPAVEPGDAGTCDVYVATHVAPEGGHTALIGDFVRARRRPAHVVLTALDRVLAEAPVPDTIARLGVTAEDVTVLPGPDRAGRLDQLFAVLARLAPDCLFLFQHPDDPLPIAAAQPDVARQRLLVHHNDTLPSFGLYVPGVRVIDLHPNGVANTCALGGQSALLPLTRPDPGPRPYTPCASGAMVTASSGSAHKFRTPYALTYAEMVTVTLATTRGRHVHVGPLDDRALADIAAALASAGVAADRFVHVEWAASLVDCLWAHACDVFLASFPLDGARTRVEVLAAGIPYLTHAKRPIAGPSVTVADLRWHTWADLEAALGGLADRARHAEAAADSRRVFERDHHPDIFRQRLRAILDGADEPPPDDAVARATRRIVGALLTAVRSSREEWLARQPDVQERMASLAETVRAQQRGVDALTDDVHRLDLRVAHSAGTDTDLAQRCERLDARLRALEQTVAARADGRGWKGRLRRWLARD